VTLAERNRSRVWRTPKLKVLQPPSGEQAICAPKFTAPTLATRLNDPIRRGRGNIVIDLSEAGFIDSLGLHALLNLQRRLSRRSRSLAVICGDGPVRRAIELARLENALGVVSSLAEYEISRAARPA
jgi:anti-anti-sigma factor